MVNTIWFWFNLIRFRKDFSVCIFIVEHYMTYNCKSCSFKWNLKWLLTLQIFFNSYYFFFIINLFFAVSLFTRFFHAPLKFYLLKVIWFCIRFPVSFGIKQKNMVIKWTEKCKYDYGVFVLNSIHKNKTNVHILTMS